MEKKQRIQTIDKFFKNEFDLNNYKEFISKIINVRLIENRKIECMSEEYKDYVENYQVISSYKDVNDNAIDVIAVKLKDGGKNQTINPVRARTKQRNFIARYLNEYSKKGALVVFYNKKKYWRLSFIKQNFLFTPEGIKKQLTSAKRASFILGKGEASYTAEKQFLSISNSKKILGIEDFDEIFKLEKVTDEFFNKYKEKYLELEKHLANCEDFKKIYEQIDKDLGKASESFAKKLMGQLSFLYFLQKKGWLGVKAIPKELSKEEYFKIYQKSSNKELLKKIYFIKEDQVKLSVSEVKDLSNEDADKLALSFEGTSYYCEFGTGENNFIRELFVRHIDLEKKYKKGRNFFNDYLEKLFYGALSIQRGKSQYFKEFNCRIPYLNGGLFEEDYKWEDTDFKIPDSIFSNGNDGILDIFDRYNFTIAENEPLETDIAVDPEMLGKVFENLLDVNVRKSKGAFYTPREIVRYMCSESIVNYLNNELVDISKKDIEILVTQGELIKEKDLKIYKEYKTNRKTSVLMMPKSILMNLLEIDKVIRNVKIADPAAGSGAFPLGMLNKIVKLRSIITDYLIIKEWAMLEKDGLVTEDDQNKIESKILNERNLYKLKLETIRNCLYGVDIEPSAIDITKLRMWLSIIIDAPKNKVDPLPNLDFNFMVGNSLLDEFEGEKLFDERLLDKNYSKSKLKNIKTVGFQLDMFDNFENFKEDIFKNIKKLQKKFFAENNKLKKKNIKNQVDGLEWQLIRVTLESSGDKLKIKELEKLRKEKRKPYFLWKLEFSDVFKEKGGFDIIIGNPPYVGEKGNKEIFHPIINSSLGEFYMGKGDLFYFFFHLGLNLLKDKGKLAYITTNYYLTADGALNLRKDLKKRSHLEKLINFNEITIFGTAKGQHNLITILEKNSEAKIKKITDTIVCLKKLNLKDIEEVLYSKSQKCKYYKIAFENLYDGQNEYIRLEKDKLIDILDRVKLNSKSLVELTNIKQGIVSGADKFTDSHKRKYNLDFKKGTGIFVLNEEEQKQISKNDKILLKNFYKNSDIKKYISNRLTDLKIIYITKKENIDDYSSIKNRLLNFKKILEAKRESKIGRLPWYSLHWSREKLMFEGEKIICPQRSYQNCFAYNNIPWFSSADVYFITKKNKEINLKYILGILNSKLCYIWLYKKGKRKGDMLELYATPLEQIPIKQISEKEQDKFIEKINKIIDLKEKEGETKELELDVDEMVYDIYGLNEEEKEIIRLFKID